MTTNSLSDGYELAEPHIQAQFQAEVAAQTFGETIWAWRKCETWTLAHVAAQLGISPQALHAYEKGKKLPSPELAYKMAQVLGLPPDYAVLQVVNEQLRRSDLPVQMRLAS